MKILHIISSLEIGGAQRLLSDLLPILAKDNEVSLLVNQAVENDFSNRLRTAGVKIILSGCKSIYGFGNIFQIARMSKEYDIIHVHLFPSLYFASMACIFAPMRFVYTEHSTYNARREKWYIRPLERFIYSNYKKIISISQQTQDALTEWLKPRICDSRFVVINNGVNLNTFNCINKETKYPHTLLMISRFDPSKDQKTVIQALEYLPGDIHIIFVGDGDTLESCRSFAQIKGTSSRIHFVGKQSDVATWISMADIGIQSSNWEGFGVGLSWGGTILKF